MAKELIKGNEALAESCLRAGCRFFSGYPITPQSDVLEYLCWRMDEIGGQCVQTDAPAHNGSIYYCIQLLEHIAEHQWQCENGKQF